MGKKTTLSPCGMFCLLLIFLPQVGHSLSGESLKNCKELWHLFESISLPCKEPQELRVVGHCSLNTYCTSQTITIKHLYPIEAIVFYLITAVFKKRRWGRNEVNMITVNFHVIESFIFCSQLKYMLINVKWQAETPNVGFNLSNNQVGWEWPDVPGIDADRLTAASGVCLFSNILITG